jgi:soluble lytic murein transglycosylase-like protein
MIKKPYPTYARIFLITLVLLTTVFCTNLWAQLYSYTDENGIRHFSNVPNDPQYKPFRKEISGTSGFYLPDRYDHFIHRASKLNGVSFPLLKAVIKAESNFDPRAVSRAGALGLMQIMPDNLTVFKINKPFDPWQNILGGSRYLKEMLTRFNGQVSLALAAYNAGPGKVDQYNDIPPYPETRAYVKRVMKYYRIIKDQ